MPSPESAGYAWVGAGRSAEPEQEQFVRLFARIAAAITGQPARPGPEE